MENRDSKNEPVIEILSQTRSERKSMIRKNSQFVIREKESRRMIYTQKASQRTRTTAQTPKKLPVKTQAEIDDLRDKLKMSQVQNERNLVHIATQSATIACLQDEISQTKKKLRYNLGVARSEINKAFKFVEALKD